MRNIAIGQMIAIFANIGVIAGIAFLGYELQQNTEALNAQSRQSVMESSQTELFLQINNPELVLDLIKDGPLTREENVKLNAWLGAVMRVREFSWLQYRQGILDDDQWNTEYAVMEFIMTNPRIRLWWQRTGRLTVSPAFVEFVDENFTDSPTTNQLFEDVAEWSSEP
jgi:hypothetical protein